MESWRLTFEWRSMVFYSDDSVAVEFAGHGVQSRYIRRMEMYACTHVHEESAKCSPSRKIVARARARLPTANEFV